MLDMGFKEHVCMVSVLKASGLSVSNEILFPNAGQVRFVIFF
jgi:hypothetical protein